MAFDEVRAGRVRDVLAEPGAATMVMRGRPMHGWITLAAHACATRSDLATWVRSQDQMHGPAAIGALRPVR